ncbi:hypothetical protein [Streptomyces brasiliensis]|uniref:hypothetical protein n=1 Tax=Streptomyces brasiliensis TaxID=1954 RepID=UPI0016704692|nr:hypothetical protein [Streptomyces brasiliensis]
MGVKEDRDNESTSDSAEPVGMPLWQAVFLIILAAAFMLLLPHAYVSKKETPAPPGHQKTFLEEVDKDRKTLVPGDFWFNNAVSSAVGESTSVAVGLYMEGRISDDPGPSSPPAGSKTHHIPVGGVEGASLTSSSDEVKIRPLFDSSEQQLVTQPSDLAEWEWAVGASEPGNYKLVLRIATYQGDSKRSLATSAPVTIRLHVKNTVSHRLSWIRGEVVAWGGVAAAVVALLAFRGPLLALAKARRDSLLERRRRGRDGYM